MIIYFTNETRAHYSFEDPEPVIRNAVEAVAKDMHLPEELEVNVILTTPSVIRSINYEMRGIDSVTDVLSFPYFSFETPGVFEHTLFSEGENILGDIVVCGSRMKEQALRYGHSQIRELSFLIVHSMLHLTGYDHIEAEDAVVMEEQQRRLMDEVLQIHR